MARGGRGPSIQGGGNDETAGVSSARRAILGGLWGHLPVSDLGDRFGLLSLVEPILMVPLDFSRFSRFISKK